MYSLHKTIKRYLLSLPILAGLVGLSFIPQATTSAAQPDSYDYTLQHHPDQVSPIENKAYIDREEIPQELASIMQAASKDHNDTPQLLTMVAEDVQNRQYYKYLFASNGLLVDSTAQQKAHQLNYHLIKAPAGPVIWQVLSLLDQKSSLEIKALMLPKNAPLCLSCGHMCLHLFGKKMPVHKAGCQGQPCPTTAAPASAIACFYSNRFTDQQRQLALAKVGDKAFPNPKKPITSPPPHYHHKPSSTDDIGIYHIEDDQKGAHQAASAAVPLPPGQLLIPANGNCLYTTIIMGYLLPVRQEADKLNRRMAQLFGHPPAYHLNRLDQTLQNPTHYLTYLHSKEFRVLVNAFMSRMQIKEGTWGGPQEIQTIATKLKVNIQAHYPDPSNRTHLVQSDLTQPAQANADITIHIIRDSVHPAEVLTQAQKVSAEDNSHYQHYRLKYTLPPKYTDDDAKEEPKEEALNKAAIANMLQIPNFEHERNVLSVSLSRHDRFLASASHDKSVPYAHALVFTCGSEETAIMRPADAQDSPFMFKIRSVQHVCNRRFV